MAAALIAKAILGGIGGGLSEAGKSNTNLSGSSSGSQTGTSQSSEADTASGLGTLAGRIISRVKKSKEEKNKNTGASE